MENIVLLGATGSVGSSVLDVIGSYPGRFRLIGASCFKNLNRMSEIINEFAPLYVSLPDNNPEFEKNHPSVYFMNGDDGINEMVALSDVDTVVVAIAGIAGLSPLLSAVESGKRILSANKEAIVAAGAVIDKILVEHKNFIIPLDSEHNAIFNQLIRMDKDSVENIVLTASGGPFRDKPIDENVTVEDVLQHPTWDMGQYITVNSATMMNKGFEVIEAHYLFNISYDKIRVLIHPQSLVHGIIETIDGNRYMSASACDMRYPVASAMFFPEVQKTKLPKLDLAGISLDFVEPDNDKFPLLALAYETGMAGGIMPAVLNAANEIVVEKFLAGFVRFYQIPGIIRYIIDKFENVSNPCLEEILIADKKARIHALELISLS
jgi:1-deoxy-D-xylulose-5-phosphate reductoisomerase